MKLIRHLDDLPEQARDGAVAIGNFDGVHRGHLRIVKRLRERAAAASGPAVVLTFDPHPAWILRPEQCPPPLTWTERKAELLVAIGVDWMVAYPTDHALLELTAREFFERIVCGKLSAKAIVEGPDFFFGKDREGDIACLRQFAAAANMELEVVEPVMAGGEAISSSRIRRLINQGDVATARAMLSQPYRLRGIVTHGAGRGASLGFPTANLVGIDTLIPSVGVYAGHGRLGNESWPAAIHVGPNPTFGEQTQKVEVHLVGRRDPLYGQILEVDFLQSLREIRPFGSAEELTAQLKQDVERAEAIARKANERSVTA